MKKAEIIKVEPLKDYTDVLTFKELKKVLKLGKNAVYKLLKDETIASFRVGTSYRILKTSVIDYLYNQ